MDSKDKAIIEKLFKVAQKQQDILVKIAQTIQEDVESNKKYLSNAWMTAALNSGIPGISPESIDYTPGGPDSNNPNIVISSTYTVTGVIPALSRELFKTNFEKQIASQKPELDGRVGMIFKDPLPKSASKINNKK
jgi:hypothetical protein